MFNPEVERANHRWDNLIVIMFEYESNKNSPTNEFLRDVSNYNSEAQHKQYQWIWVVSI